MSDCPGYGARLPIASLRGRGICLLSEFLLSEFLLSVVQLAAVLLAVTLLGCGQVATDSAPQQNGTPRAAQPQPQEFWDVVHIMGAKVGHVRTQLEPLTTDGQARYRVTTETNLSVARFGQRTEIEVQYTSVETAQGQLIEFDSRTKLGTQPTETSGQIVGDELVLTTTNGESTKTVRMPWSTENGGFYVLELSLAADPMEPGEQRAFRAFMPLMFEVAEVELKAIDYESTDLLGGTYELLRIDSRSTLPDGTTLESVLWSDRSGQILRSYTALMEQETFRTTKALALEQDDAVELDLGLDALVKVDRRLTRPHQTRRIRYRLTLESGDPASVFVSGPTQAFESLGPHEANLTVTAITPHDVSSTAEPSGGKPTDADRQASTLVEVDDKTVIALARRASPEIEDPGELALALERFVHQHIDEKNFSQTFASAAEVARTGEGDCTEHAVLLAALARARGIPARVAIGLVYVDRFGGFGYHMWNELYLNGHWIPFDATLGQGGIGAAHLKLAQSSLAGSSAYSSFLPVAQVLGQLKIEVLDVE